MQIYTAQRKVGDWVVASHAGGASWAGGAFPWLKSNGLAPEEYAIRQELHRVLKDLHTDHGSCEGIEGKRHRERAANWLADFLQKGGSIQERNLGPWNSKRVK